jgi:predicted nucleotidyltransferase component of viral defense system
MMQINNIKNFFPIHLQNNIAFSKYMLKEYIQLMILDFLSSSIFIKNISFIGGTNLRLVKGIDRFSEDIDLDCKNFSESDFLTMTNNIVAFLRNFGLNVETRDRKNKNLTAFRRNLYFPELLYKMNLSGHKDERFLIKIEAQDQQITYKSNIATIKGCGLIFPFPVPPDQILCSMKIAAMLERQKGRDFYDVIFLLSQTTPDFDFLQKKSGVSNLDELKLAVLEKLSTTNLQTKRKDFEHLLFNKENSLRILQTPDFFKSLSI